MKKVSIDKNEVNSLIAVIDYLTYSEYKHFEECDDAEKNNHIYHHIAQLKSLLAKAQTETTNN